MYPVSYLICLYILSLQEDVLVMPLFIITNSVLLFPYFLLLQILEKCIQSCLQKIPGLKYHSFKQSKPINPSQNIPFKMTTSGTTPHKEKSREIWNHTHSYMIPLLAEECNLRLMRHLWPLKKMQIEVNMDVCLEIPLVLIYKSVPQDTLRDA